VSALCRNISLFSFFFTNKIHCRRSSSHTRRSSSSLPSVCSSSRDAGDRKSAMQLVIERHHQQAWTDSAISVQSLSGDNCDDMRQSSTTPSSSSSSPLSPLQLYTATPTTTTSVTSGHVTRLRRGMTSSGDDLYPSRMRTALSMSTPRPPVTTPADDVSDTKRRDESKQLQPADSNTAAIHGRRSERQQNVAGLWSVSEGRRPVVAAVRRHQRHVHIDDDSGRLIAMRCVAYSN